LGVEEIDEIEGIEKIEGIDEFHISNYLNNMISIYFSRFET